MKAKGKSRFRILIMMICIFFAGSLMLPASCVAGETAEAADVMEYLTDSPVRMDVVYGYDEAAKTNRYIPIQINLDNVRDEDFNGTVRVLSQEADYDIYHYNDPVSVVAGGKNQVGLDIPLGGRTDQLYVQLLDQNGVQLIEKRLKLSVDMDIAELFVGILSDSPEHLSYLDGVGISHSMLKTRTFSMTAENFPSQQLGLDLLDVILISDFDAGTLSKDQLSAIEGWVQNGGTLILGTGERVSESLGAFTPWFLETEYSGAGTRSVDMGVEYAEKGPGDSFIEIPVANLSLKNGSEVLSSDELPILISAQKDSGIAAIAAYDFKDIENFCLSQRSYVDKLFTSLLGEERINNLSNALYNGNSGEYWSVQSMINTGDLERLPSLPLYVGAVIIYLLLVGPGLYIFLKRQERRRYYRTGIVVLSLAFTALIYAMGGRTRFHSTFINYATIQDVGAEEITESVYLNMRTPYSKPYSLALDPSYQIMPLTRSSYYDMVPIPQFTGKEDYNVSLSYGEDATTVNVQNVVAFNPKYFFMQKQTPNENKGGLTGDVTLFDGKVSGTVTNHFDYGLENAALLMSGQMVMIGELKPGETRSLDNLKLNYYPPNYSFLVAERISGGYKYTETDIQDKDYMKTLAKTNILNFYLSSYMSVRGQDARIVAFSQEPSQNTFLVEGACETYGTSLLTSKIKINTEKDGMIFRSSLYKAPTVVSGSYDVVENMAYGIDPVVLLYSLGNDLQVEKVTFNQLSSEFQNQNKSNLLPFTGTIYFYNHNTNNYDKMNSSQTQYTGDQLEPYLSPGNTITVKYVGDNTGTDYNWYVMLPMVTVIGRDK